MRNTIKITQVKAELAQAGIIGENENIYTKNVWRKMGYKVNKEESPITIIRIYVYAPHKVYDKNGKEYKTRKMLNVLANFYKVSQVTKLEKKGA